MQLYCLIHDLRPLVYSLQPSQFRQRTNNLLNLSVPQIAKLPQNLLLGFAVRAKGEDCGSHALSLIGQAIPRVYPCPTGVAIPVAVLIAELVQMLVQNGVAVPVLRDDSSIAGPPLFASVPRHKK